ncbi:hypothetical protein DPMN_154176 [Dreissena polymorpha]|uniref:Uncharacterized protein n=1 Tax=Dreissena polymorpha TaxID=45954 RepID=A0A9D4FKH7_DREPO|nr:hypothetical protein DPMN_154176 [Dreissena polymorpha]
MCHERRPIQATPPQSRGKRLQEGGVHATHTRHRDSHIPTSGNTVCQKERCGGEFEAEAGDKCGPLLE